MIYTPLVFSISTNPSGSDSATCSAVWQQCGGNLWSGPTCCQIGNTCTFDSEWYSQCLPGVDPGDDMGDDGGDDESDEPVASNSFTIAQITVLGVLNLIN